MNKRTIKQRIMRCTPRELQRIIETIHSWKGESLNKGESLDKIETVQDVIGLLTRPEYIEEARRVEDETGEPYFEVVFDINR